MSSFNLKRRRKKRPIDLLRSLGDDCANLRPSDLDDATEQEVAGLYNSLRSREEKMAAHGRGDNWTQDISDPYAPSDMTTFAPQFGGRWRRNFPGGGDHHINDDSDKQKNLRGQATDDDFDPRGRINRINDKLEKARRKQDERFVVVLEMGEGQGADEDLAVSIFGENGKVEGRLVYVEVDDFDEATRIQRRVPGSRVERKRRQK